VALTPAQEKKATELRKKGWLHNEIASELVTSEDTIRRYLRSVGLSGRIERSYTRRDDRLKNQVGAGAKDREIIRLRDEVSRLTSEITSAHRDRISDDEVRKLLKAVGDAPEKPPAWLITPKKTAGKPEVPVTIWSDWHGGEVVEKEELDGANEYNMAIMKARVRKLVERTMRLTEKQASSYPGIVVNLLGDFISGNLHPALEKTDEAEPIAAALELRDVLVWALTEIVNHYGRVFVPCAAGNHGRNTPKPQFKRYIYENFDWMIYKLLERHFAGDKRIQFDIRASNEVFYRVWNHRFLAMHGDMLGVKGGDGIIGAIGPIMRGEVKVRGSMVSMAGDYDTLLMGHWHQPLWLPRVIVANSLKGYDEYAKNALRAPYTLPSQPLFFVHPSYGVTSRWEIYLEGRKDVQAKEWVAVLKAAA
jgi:hypothetical protein